MKNTCLLVVLLSCVTPFSDLAAAESAKPVFDQRSWKLGWSQGKEGAVLEEYVLDGESVENWSELVTVQFFPGLQAKTNPDIFEASQRRNMALVCPAVQWESLHQAADERIWKWSITGCTGQVDQSEIARLKRTDEGFHVWHYAIKKAPIPPEQEKAWLENLRTITVTEGP